MNILKQSTAVDVIIGPFVDSTDGDTEETALTLSAADIKLSKNGQTMAGKNDATAAAHDANGMYNCELDATDTNTVGALVLFVHETGALAVRHEFQIVEEAVYDAMYGASAAGPLQSTTAGRTLDVTATGAAGIDWANVENPTTAVDLSSTDIQLADTVTTLTTKTGFSLSATGLDAIASTATGMVEIAKAIWDRVLSGATHNITDSAGRRLRQIDAAFEVHNGTAQAGTSTTITLDTGASATDDIYNGDRIVITEGTGAQEHGLVIDYNGTTKVATMSKAWVVTPDATSVFEVVPADSDIETWNNIAVTGDGDWAEMQTDLDEVLVDTGTTIPGTITTLQADTDDIQTRLPAALVSGRMSSDTVALSGSTTAADNLEASALGIVPGTCEGTPTTTVIQTDLAESTDDHYIGRVVVFTSGNAAYEASDITDYTGSTGTITVTALTTAPAASDSFVIV